MKPSVKVMVPVKIKPSMLGAGTTVPEPNISNGEVAWVASAAYAIGAERTSEGSVWICNIAHTGRTALPAQDPIYWDWLRSTDRMACFDDYTSTKTRGTGSVSVVVAPGFFSAVRVYGPEGDTANITVRSPPGGAIVREQTFDLFAQAAGFYELLFTVLPPLEQFGMDDLPLLPNAEITITVSAYNNGPVAIGDIKLGDWRSLTGDSPEGGTQYGARSQRNSHTVRRYDDNGGYAQVKRAGWREVTCTIELPSDQAMYADAVLGEIMDVAVPFEATNLPEMGYLNAMGFFSGSLSPINKKQALLTATIRGNI